MIKLRSININAQNALLKSLEDIKENNIIVLVVDDVKIFLPTVLSRGIVIKGQREKNLAKREEDSDIDEFIEGNIVTRKSLADLWYKLKKKDPDILKDKAFKINEHIERRPNLNLKTKAVLLKAKNFQFDQGANYRLVIVFLSLALPSKLS